MPDSRLPLFPLNTVLFPGGRLPLRIFEPRYLSMVSQCLTQQQGFGVCLIRAGREVGEPVLTWPVGTLAMIDDWDQGADGLLTILAVGVRRFRLLDCHVQDDGLSVAQVEWLPEETSEAVPADCASLVNLLDTLLAHMEGHGGYAAGEDRQPHNAAWLSGRLTELLNLPMAQKQALLELDSPARRLWRLQKWVRTQGSA